VAPAKFSLVDSAHDTLEHVAAELAKAACAVVTIDVGAALRLPLLIEEIPRHLIGERVMIRACILHFGGKVRRAISPQSVRPVEQVADGVSKPTRGRVGPGRGPATDCSHYQFWASLPDGEC
jgi:hypothetical protein